MSERQKVQMETTDTVAELEINPKPEAAPPTDESQLMTRSHGITHRGLVRAANEDQFLIAQLNKALQVEQSSVPQPKTWHGDDQGRLFLVADGIGGSRGGDRASELAVRSIEHFLLHTLKWFCELQVPEEETVTCEMQKALRQADARLFMESAVHPELHGMGTTLTLGFLLHRNLYVVHAGDSRCYIFREGNLEQLTRDHTIAAELADRGMITPDQVHRHPLRHMITNAVGGQSLGVRADVHKVRIEPGDVLLFATDGLSRMVPDPQIAETLAAHTEPRAACEHLLQLALDAGGRDNVTVIVSRHDPLPANGS